MSPIEYIAEGIRQGNWETVCEGYERLTGKALPLPTTMATTDGAGDALRQIADIASSVLDGPTAEICDTAKKPVKKKPGRPKGGGKKKKKKKATVNKNGEDSSIQIDEDKRTIVQKETGGTQLITNDADPEEVERNKAKAAKANKNKVKLNRQAARKYKVKCNECGETFESDRKGGEMGQKCPGCLKEKKSRFA
ncbi:MAG: hypothetical protein DRJ03_00240 [Chloroflexi bacterium]|nr:MAG: hypothetical protein DRJ03_00240 [Chloroflexota bacterium]